MKTAMQELIEYLDDTLPKSIKEQYLKKEKEQIIDAYNHNMTGFDKLEQEEI